MNVELLDQIKQAILEEPRRIRMYDWVTRISDVPEDKRPPCGTVACIAGWAVALSTGLRGDALYDYDGISSAAADLLDCDPDILFHVSEWPKSWRERLDKVSSGTPAYAAVVAEFIDEFIRTNGDVVYDYSD